MTTVKDIYILGGTGVVSADVEAELTSLGYNVCRYGGADRCATSKAIMSAIPKEMWGPYPKIVNGYDWIQGFSVASDIKFFCPIDKKTYINPVFAIPETANKLADIQTIQSELKDVWNSWETREKGIYSPQLDKNYYENVVKTMPAKFQNIEPLLLSETDNNQLSELLKAQLGELKTINFRWLSTGYNAKTTAANVSINANNQNTMMAKKALLTSSQGYADTLSASALSAKLSAPIVMADKTAQEVLGRAATDSNINSQFLRTYGSVIEADYIGGAGVLPDGRDIYLDGK